MLADLYHSIWQGRAAVNLERLLHPVLPRVITARVEAPKDTLERLSVAAAYVPQTPAMLVLQNLHFPCSMSSEVTAKMSRSATAFLQLGQKVVPALSTS